METRVQWLSWLCISRMIRSSLELLVCFFTHSRIFKNKGPMIQLLWGLLTNPMLPGGTPYISESWSLALGRMKTGGTVLPTELMIIHVVIIVPRTPTCFINVIHTVSWKFPRFKCTLITVEKFHYVCFLECRGPEDTCIFELAKLVKPCNQSIPAILLSIQLLENLHCSLPLSYASQWIFLYVIP